MTEWYNDACRTNKEVFGEKYRNMSEYIITEIINNEIYSTFIHIATETSAYRLRAEDVYAYTVNGNDCLGLYVNKHFSIYIDIKTIVGIEPA